MDHQWPALGTGVLAAVDLRGAACEPHHRATEQTNHKLKNNDTKGVLALLQKFPGPQQIFQPGDLVQGLRTCRELDFES